MLRWKPPFLAEDDVRYAEARIRAQDDEFCEALRAAIEAGKEICPIGVITEPGTKRPLLNYQRPEYREPERARPRDLMKRSRVRGALALPD